MGSATLFIVAGAISILILANDVEVDAAPDPCIIWNHRHRHVEQTTPKSETLEATSKKPIDDKKDKFNKLEKIIEEWLFSENSEPNKSTTTTTTTPPPPPTKDPMEEIVSSYMNFVSYLLSR